MFNAVYKIIMNTSGSILRLALIVIEIVPSICSPLYVTDRVCSPGSCGLTLRAYIPPSFCTSSHLALRVGPKHLATNSPIYR